MTLFAQIGLLLRDMLWHGLFHDWSINTKAMFVPITSEITLGTGMVLKEIATGHLFKIGRRLKDGNAGWGDDPWELLEIMGTDPQRKTVAYLELSEKYLAEVEEEPH